MSLNIGNNNTDQQSNNCVEDQMASPNQANSPMQGGSAGAGGSSAQSAKNSVESAGQVSLLPSLQLQTY